MLAAYYTVEVQQMAVDYGSIVIGGLCVAYYLVIGVISIIRDEHKPKRKGGR